VLIKVIQWREERLWN